MYVWTNSTASASGAVVTIGISFGAVSLAGKGVACQLASNQCSCVPSGFSSHRPRVAQRAAERMYIGFMSAFNPLAFLLAQERNFPTVRHTRWCERRSQITSLIRQNSLRNPWAPQRFVLLCSLFVGDVTAEVADQCHAQIQGLPRMLRQGETETS
jgi:hypothetical protein